MNFTNDRKASARTSMLLAAAALVFSPAAYSLGLGDASVDSYLNQPLKARIDLISQASDDLGSVTVRLASARDYELIGANRDSVSVPIQFTVEGIDGDAYILATSNLPVADPVLRLIVEVTWSSGRMLREYTLFLDPPTTTELAPPPVPRIDQRRSAPPPPSAAETTPAPAPAAAEAASPMAEEPAVVPATGEYGPVRSGETLWGIASTWARGSGLSVNQVMIAIQRENPEAFLDNNINLLKRGAILRMPKVSDVEQISLAAAIEEVASQGEAFAGRASAPAASPTTPLLAEESAAPEPAAPPPAEEPDLSLRPEEPAAADAVDEGVEEAAEAAAEDAEAAVDETLAQDLLELVPPSSASELESTAGFEEAIGDAAEGGDVETLRESLARTEEELINQQQQNEYLEERIRELETQLESAEEPGVEDADAANMQERLREQRQAAAREAAQQADGAVPWYARLSTWLIGLLVVVVAAVGGWLFRRRAREFDLDAAAEDSLRDIKSEAEDVLRVLSDDAAPKPAEAEADEAGDADVEEDRNADGHGEDNVTPIAAARPRRKDDGGGVSAEMLDEDSSDPEIQLDLARAYISMGDKEAARVILQEVLANGTEQQQGEAQKMLDLLAGG